MKNTKISLILILTIISMLVFTGCNSSTNTPLVMSPIIETIYLNNLQELVIDKTITQRQSDKVLEEVKTNMLESKGCYYGLLALVRDGVIKQGQSDKINHKIMLAMKAYKHYK